jgi:putative membrane-bound dehydrogenase-like protein
MVGLISCKPQEATAPIPNLLDARLSLSLLAQDPEIVTPVGIAIASLDRVYVLESHTHLPPENYPGPKGDNVKVFTDTNDDGQFDNVAIYASGIQEGLQIAFSPDGMLYVVTSRAVVALIDQNGDGVCDEQRIVLALNKPESVYAHAALLSLTFSNEWMYVARGNTGGQAWQLTGTDGSFCSGYGDGGNIVRARPDGSALEQIATGFWNPADIKFDSRGNLLAADNDPDSRGPNRLVHVVRGGDYGYKSLYGGSGIHPYLAWNGELPATLPYAVPLGEAPSGLLDANLTTLPADYEGQMLATIWEESRIVRVELEPKGISLQGSTKVIVEGAEDFRPVAFAADSKGNVYFTDWVLRNYPNHGKGKIWKLATKSNTTVRQDVSTNGGQFEENSHRLLDGVAPADDSTLRASLHSSDPFIRHLAVMQLQQDKNAARALLLDESSRLRLGSAVALQRSGYTPSTLEIRALLTCPDEQVRRQALIWIGEAGLVAYKREIGQALLVASPSPQLFEIYLATVRHLTDEFQSAYRGQTQPYARSIPRQLPPGFMQQFITNEPTPAAIKVLATRYLDHPKDHVDLLLQLTEKAHDEALRIEAIRSLASVPGAATRVLLQIATNVVESPVVRAEAVASLSYHPGIHWTKILPLLRSGDELLKIQAIRYLRTAGSSDSVRQALKSETALSSLEASTALKEQLGLALEPERRETRDLAARISQVSMGGDPVRGRFVFFSREALCSACHAVEGRGGDLGPELTAVAWSKPRDLLATSILEPASDVSPEYQGWYITLKGGKTHQGRQIDIGDKSMELYTYDMGNVKFDKDIVASYGMIDGSLMPDDLGNKITDSDLCDLLAYLEFVAMGKR